MAVNMSRSLNTELEAGRLDGTIKKVARNRGGKVDAATQDARATLAPEYGVEDRATLDYVEAAYTHGDESLPL